MYELHPKYPPDRGFPPQRHRRKIKHSWYRVYLKLIYTNKPYSQPDMPMPWDDGYHNSYIDIFCSGGQPEAKYLALRWAYKNHHIQPFIEYVTTKAALLQRRVR